MNDIVSTLPSKDLERFCLRWKIRELAVFGSALRDDYRPESDVDVLVTFSDASQWGLFDHAQMQQELQTLLHRKVDLVSRRALRQTRNVIIRDEILRTAKTFFSEGETVHAER
jgi:predicted nucleotidyltransferase